MPIYPDIPFVDGQVFTPDLAYLCFHQSFGDSLDQDILGNHPGITDAQLSDDALAIKNRVNTVLNPFQLSVVSGTTINVASGVASLTGGALVTLPSTNIVLPDNTTSFIYLDNSGALVHSNSLPVVCYHIGNVTTSGGSVTNIVDKRNLAIRQVEPRTASIKSFGGTSNTDIICTALTDLTAGLFYCRDFIVPSGVSVTVPGWLRLYVSRNVQIDGSLIISPISDGGVAANFSPDNTANLRGINRGSGLGTAGSIYGWGFQSYGSGGFSGEGLMNNISTFIRVPGGGKGGGGLVIEAGGSITGSGTIQAKGTDGTGGYTYLGGSPTNTTPGYFEPGTSASIYGSNGGTGGFVSLSSLSGVSFTGTIDVRGGNGGLSMTNITGYFAGGGCPGAGGVIVITSPSYNISGATLMLTGGAFGTTQQLVTGASVSGGVWTLPIANTTSLYNSRPGASFSTLGGYWSVAIVAPNYTVTPVAAQPGSLVLRNYTPLG